jgi:GntR family transcriptional regulator, transcriptional repressor for pyruvate dehydrogenase complex
MPVSPAPPRLDFTSQGGVSVAERVVGTIERAIRGGGYQPGVRLGTKDELRQQLGVANATLGEALRVLNTRGVVELRRGPGGGIFVADQSPLTRLGHQVLELRPDQAGVADCIAVLDALDGEIMRDAAVHRTAADIAALREALTRLETAWPRPDEAQQRIWDLHRRIAEVSPNAVLKAIYLNLVDYIQRDLGSAIHDAGYGLNHERRLRIHAALVEAIVAGDVRLADKANARHRSAPRA